MPAPTIVDQTVITECGQNFKTIAKHRRAFGYDIAKWSITIPEEYISFKNALQATVTNGVTPDFDSLNLCWGVHISEGILTKLGENHNNTNIKFAKFTKHINNHEWHGYPADYQNKPQDVPSSKYLTKLKDDNYLTKSNLNKIIQGKSCSL